MRAKLEDGKLSYPPHVSVRADGSTVVGYDQRTDLQAEDGYLVVVDTPRPETGLFSDSWEIVDGCITRVWTPRERTDAEKAYDEQIAAQNQRAAEWIAEHTAKVQGLRDAYAAATAQLCQLAGLPVARVLTMDQVQQAVMPLLSGPNAGIANGLLTLLTNLEGKLKDEDRKDALDRV